MHVIKLSRPLTGFELNCEILMRFRKAKNTQKRALNTLHNFSPDVKILGLIVHTSSNILTLFFGLFIVYLFTPGGGGRGC